MTRNAEREDDRPSWEAKQGDARRRWSHELWAKQEEYSTLVGAGFEPTYEKDLWKKDGVWFGKEAALQHAWREVAN